MIILASASPRRQELIKLIFDDFTVIPSDIDENVNVALPVEKYPEYLANFKAKSIAENGHYEDVVIGCDTGVFIDNKMLGKPKNKDNAKQMLKLLSGKKHKVITGCAIFYRDKKICFSETTEVEFYTLTNEEIDAYVDSGEPMDKAGAYGIQGKGALLVKGIVGDYQNVVGLPVAALSRKLQIMGIQNDNN